MSRNDRRSHTVERECINCKSFFHPFYGFEETAKYCSRKCRHSHFKFSEETRKRMSAIRKGRFGMENHPLWKGKIKRTGYWYIKNTNHPFSGKQGYIAEHRIVMEKHLGRFLKPEEVVHHVNGDTTDNRIENLELFATHGQHTKNAHGDLFVQQSSLFKGKHFSKKTEWKKGDPRLMGHTYNNGKPSWNKGRKWSAEHRKKLRLAHIGKHKVNSTSFKNGMIPWNKIIKN